MKYMRSNTSRKQRTGDSFEALLAQFDIRVLPALRGYIRGKAPRVVQISVLVAVGPREVDARGGWRKGRHNARYVFGLEETHALEELAGGFRALAVVAPMRRDRHG